MLNNPIFWDLFGFIDSNRPVLYVLDRELWVNRLKAAGLGWENKEVCCFCINKGII